MDLIKSCASRDTIPEYEEMASQNKLLIGRPDDFEEYFGRQPEAGSSVTLKIFDGTDVKEMDLEIAAVLDQKKIGNNGDKIDMLLLPMDSISKIAASNTTYQYMIRVADNMEQQAQKEMEQILTSAPRLSERSKREFFTGYNPCTYGCSYIYRLLFSHEPVKHYFNGDYSTAKGICSYALRRNVAEAAYKDDMLRRIDGCRGRIGFIHFGRR